MSDTRQHVLQTARQLFGERGYGAVTIREIAAAAGLSPAMVMKVGGSKEQLHAEATPLEPEPLPRDVPLEGLGEILVARMLTRRAEDAAEPWLRAIYLIVDAPDPATARRDFRERFLNRFENADGAEHGSNVDPDAWAQTRRQADQLACLMVGLAAGVRTLRLLDPATTDTTALVTEYGALVQQVLDRMPTG